jgi:hypothetical protein
MRTESTKDSKKLAPGQLWMSFRHHSKTGQFKAYTTLLVKKVDEWNWFILRTTEEGRFFTHVPALNFIGDELDEDDEEVTFVQLA